MLYFNIRNIVFLIIIIIQFSFSPKLLGQESHKNYFINDIVINSNDKIDPQHFNHTVLEDVILSKLNKYLNIQKLNPFSIDSTLYKVANDQANYMATMEQLVSVQKEKNKETIADRMMFYGGSKNAEELIDKNNLAKSGIFYTYEKIADDFVFSWLASAKKADIFTSGIYHLMGISTAIDSGAKRVYVSVVVGNFKSFNRGKQYINELPEPYSLKIFGLSEPDPINCKKINRSNEINYLQDALSTENNTIYINVESEKNLKKIIKKSKDGLAVEILQKEQFPCNKPNIIDYNLPNQGIITKKLYSKKLFKNNVADLEENPNAFKAQLGTIPEGINDGYELNLVIIQNKSYCRSIPQNFIIQTSGTYTRKVRLLADTVNINSRFDYRPQADSLQLTFRIPFENKKANYQANDIEPFIKSLNEPAFLIYEINILAYSSIEGSDVENKILQSKRAQSIINALKTRQKDSVKTEIVTAYNWDDFTKDISKTKYKELANMSTNEAQEYIRKNKIQKELEPILQHHRYAQIEMNVISDITGENEAPFVLKKFNEAIDNNDRALALSIEKYLMQQILKRKYNIETIKQLTIPLNEDYAGLLMNKYWLMHKYKLINSKQLADSVAELITLAPNNEYIAFNDVLFAVTQKNTDLNSNTLQSRIDRLYYTPLAKETVDALNIKYQFKRINNADSIALDPKIKEECIERIKQIVDIKGETLNNSLKLAELFIDNKDYMFAYKTLEPWVTHSDANENLIYTFISLCSQDEVKMHTEKFNRAMQKAQAINPQRYCELFNGTYFSLRIFENEKIKESYCKHCANNTDFTIEN